MKALIVIVSIILLSYQIDRFFTKDSAITPVEVQNYDVKEFQQELPKTEESSQKQAEFLQEATEVTTSPDSQTVVIDVALTTGENIEVGHALLASNKTEVATVSHAVVRKSHRLQQGSKINQHAKAFHSQLKDLGSYTALNTVQFGYNKFDVLGSEDFTTVMHYADLLIFDDNLKVSIAGFADNSGDSLYNEQLSLMRAMYVQNYLVDLGVDKNQILISAYGIESPIADNKTKEGRALNRRVELLLIAESN